jgi:hypothetical protein
MARGLTADIMGGPVDLATSLLNLGIAGTGYAGNKLGLIPNDKLPTLIDKPLGGSDWFAGQNTPISDNGTLGYQVGRLATSALPGASKALSKIPTPSLSEVGAFNFPGWHGTTAGLFPEFKANIRKNEQLGFGVHSADSEAFAKLYASDPNIARKGKSPAMYKVNVSSENPLNLDQIVSEGSTEFELAKLLAGRSFYPIKDAQGRPSVYLQNAVDSRDPKTIQKILEAQGIDALRYISRVGSLPLNGGSFVSAKDTSTVALSPKQIQILEARLLSPQKGN